MSVNKVILLGNVGQDPRIRYVQTVALAEFSLATTERAYRNAEGLEIPERTEWHNIVMRGRNAETAEKYVRRGTKLYIEGRLRTRTWEDRNAIKRTVTEILVDTFEILSRPATGQP
ncbi:MAG: single-stranded DNA-binding protein [Paramuribaculum sp.]|nr:single-stranded DNA-binding protein [Candidatus Amulumruptor sp.]MDE6588355.1 single-stranded DNA-binding protein [Paramuribaculum sp.]MDE7151066.1 single-stranded DNA-binding protein [Candidatus Amulumruptor sp.]